jgi:tryptophan 2,3-dioxygenase
VRLCVPADGAAMSKRKLEEGIVTDLRERLTYAGYLDLETLLTAQKPLSDPPHHDEMLFIIQHQVGELWFKLMLHELAAANRAVVDDDLRRASKTLARVKQVQIQLISQWSVLDSLTPTEYAEFRGVLGNASGFQSFQYRCMEFMLGNKMPEMLKLFRHEKVQHAELEALLHAPGIFDEFLRCLHRRGHPIPADRIERDWSQVPDADARVVEALRGIYTATERHWDIYEFCEKLVDLEQNFQVWRFRHMKAVERIIGYKPGTGGSSGVAFLRKVLENEFFPELYQVRTTIG